MQKEHVLPMSEFRFAHPFVFLILLIGLVFLYYWWRSRWSQTQSVLRYSDIRLATSAHVGLRLRLRRLPDLLRLLAWFLLIFALARPQMGKTQTITRGQGIDMVIVVDISGSMAIPDFAPRNRLDASKVVINNFIDGREYDRIGVVVFANDSFQLTPPTLDYDILKQSINRLQLASDVGIQDGSAVGLGIASAANMLRSSPAPSKVIILVTDGENNVGSIDAISAAQASNTLGIRIYTIGIGQRGIFTLTQPDGTIDTITSNLDEDTLQQIADIGQGEYFYAADLLSLQAIYDRIDRLERSPVQRQQLTRWQDIGDGIILLVFLLLLSERFLRHTLFQTIP